MVQTLTIWSNGNAEINTGSNFLSWEGGPFSVDLDAKIADIQAAIFAEGISQLHVERDTFRRFEHVVEATSVSLREFGKTVSVEDFDWIMLHVDAEIIAQAERFFGESEPELL
jgi:hypothetical protein